MILGHLFICNLSFAILKGKQAMLDLTRSEIGKNLVLDFGESSEYSLCYKRARSVYFIYLFMYRSILAFTVDIWCYSPLENLFSLLSILFALNLTKFVIWIRCKLVSNVNSTHINCFVFSYFNVMPCTSNNLRLNKW